MKSSLILRLSLAACLIGAVGFSSGLAVKDPVKPLVVSGDIPTTVSFSEADLDKLPQLTADSQEEDGTVTKYSGVLLRDVLAKAGAPIGKALRGKSLASYILAKARDGYEVVFTPGELDQTFGNERVLVVYKRSGKPLFGYEGPYRILCPNDKAGARSLRMLETLEIVKLRK